MNNGERKTLSIPKASGWIKWIPYFREAWNSELFARLYKTSRMRSIIHPRLALFGGFIISLSISLTYMRVLDGHGLDEAFGLVIAIPVVIIPISVFIRILVAIFGAVPARIDSAYKRLTNEGADRSRISHSELALVRSLAPILLGRNVIEAGFDFSLAYFTAGGCIYLLLLRSSDLYSSPTNEIGAVVIMITFLQSMLTLLQVMVLFSITGYLYDNGSRIAAFLLSAAHTGFAWMLGLIPFLMLPNFVGLASDETLMIAFLVMCAIQTGVLLAFCGYALWTAVERHRK